MSSLYTTGEDVDHVRSVVGGLLRDGGYDVELADDYAGYSIAIDILDLYDAAVVARYLAVDLSRPVATHHELDAGLVAS